MEFELISEVYFCVYCSESFASLQEDENKRLIWKNI
jgi:DNA-directed RNA polymerase subunit RPC12/RpoP